MACSKVAIAWATGKCFRTISDWLGLNIAGITRILDPPTFEMLLCEYTLLIDRRIYMGLASKLRHLLLNTLMKNTEDLDVEWP